MLQLLPVPTPRWPDLLCVYSPEDNLLFSSKLFSAHVAPSLAGTSGEAAVDVGGWDVFGTDWRHFFDCMLAPVAKQAAGGALPAHAVRCLASCTWPIGGFVCQGQARRRWLQAWATFFQESRSLPSAQLHAGS